MYYCPSATVATLKSMGIQNMISLRTDDITWIKQGTAIHCTYVMRSIFDYIYISRECFHKPMLTPWLTHWNHCNLTPDSKVHGANMGPTWVLSAPDGPHVGPMNLAIRGTRPLIYCEWIHFFIILINSHSLAAITPSFPSLLYCSLVRMQC